MSSSASYTTGGSLPRANHDDSNSNVDPIVQYILVRTDLNWNTGALIAQACHASVAAITSSMEHPNTRRYLKDLENMHKIVLKADNEDSLQQVQRNLSDARIHHHLWIEQPENIQTCLAVSPQPKTVVQTIFKHFKLLK